MGFHVYCIAVWLKQGSTSCGLYQLVICEAMAHVLQLLCGAFS